ncbi:unnamed protein product [Phytophthora lilii]|uniref:Unnamed protein product n=1 Tax=Phytophthora lilii TaxID=2077276 RepID=A0A9W6U7D4_9STRA|nr:unnamed protein product [Phytophthora lilii]
MSVLTERGKMTSSTFAPVNCANESCKANALCPMHIDGILHGKLSWRVSASTFILGSSRGVVKCNHCFLESEGVSYPTHRHSLGVEYKTERVIAIEGKTLNILQQSANNRSADTELSVFEACSTSSIATCGMLLGR